MNRKNLIRMSLKHLMRLNEGVTRTSTIGELLASGDITESTTVAELMSMMSVEQQSSPAGKSTSGDKKGIDPGKLDIARDSIAYYLNASYGKFAGNYGDVIGGKKVGFGKKDCEKMLDEVFLKMGMPCAQYPQPGCARFYVDTVFAEFVESGILVTNAGTVANAAGTRYASPKDIPVSQDFDFKGSLKEFRAMDTSLSNINVYDGINEFSTGDMGGEEMYDIGDVDQLEMIADNVGEEIAMYVEEFMEESI